MPPGTNGNPPAEVIAGEVLAGRQGLSARQDLLTPNAAGQQAVLPNLWERLGRVGEGSLHCQVHRHHGLRSALQLGVRQAAALQARRHHLVPLLAGQLRKGHLLEPAEAGCSMSPHLCQAPGAMVAQGYE
jgi:hypothetical protein